MKIYFIILLNLFCVGIVFSQQVKIKISNLATDKATISFLEGENSTGIDTIISADNGEFQFNVNNQHSGFYRISFNKNKWVDFIHDNEDVEIETNANNILDSLIVIKSASNKLYYKFIKLNKSYKTKTELLQLLLSRYPKDDDFYNTTQNKLLQIQNEYLRFVDTTSQHNPESFVARYICSAQLSVVPIHLSLENQLEYLKHHALDNVNFQDGRLTNSDLFTNKTIEYLTYYRNPQLPKELLEKEFEKAIDTLLDKAKVNLRVYKQIVAYLINGFKQYGFEEDLDYVVQNYVIRDDLCLDDKTEKSIQLMIGQTKNLPVGAAVPDIVLSDTSGNVVDLNKVKADTTVILFYASWCPHCQATIPKLVTFLNSRKDKDIKVFAVSIDTIRKDWKDFIRTNNLNWINVSDLNGWNGKAAKDYFIYATPTMFLINRNNKILAKPLTVEGLSAVLK